MNYYLGVDIGTTSAKAVAFDGNGDIICKHSVSYEMNHPQLHYAEQDVNEIVGAVFSSINQVLQELKPALPEFLSFSAMMHSLIAVDKAGNPLTACIIWADNRAFEIAGELRNTERGRALYHATGVPIHAMSPFCKLLWLQHNEPSIFNAAEKFIGIKEYIFFKLFGSYAVDLGIASATGILNIQTLRWDDGALEILDMLPEQLSELVAVEKVFTYDNSNGPFPLLNKPLPFVIGGSDGALANLGTGSTAGDSMSVTIGTSGAVRILTDKPLLDEAMRLFCYHASHENFIVGGASNNGAVVIQWLKENILETADDFEHLFQLAEGIRPGAEGLLMIPYILGERAPVWNSEARGVFFGLSIGHAKPHLIRAAMEGVIYNLSSIGKPILELVKVKEINAAGGFAQSRLWLQILADVFNLPVVVSGSPESSALGAIILGLQALNIPVKIIPPIVSRHLPNADDHALYQHYFQKFEKIYLLLSGEFASAKNFS